MAKGVEMIVVRLCIQAFEGATYLTLLLLEFRVVWKIEDGVYSYRFFECWRVDDG